MVRDKLLPLTILLTYKDKIMIHILNIPATKAIEFVNATVVVTLLNNEVQFTTYEGEPVESLEDLLLNPYEGFIYTGVSFTMQQLGQIKDLLLDMLGEHFQANPGSFLKYTPTCSKRGRIYLAYLKRAGYTTIDYGDNDYLIVYPH